MDTRFDRVAGLDVHRDSVMATSRVTEGGKRSVATERFGATSGELLALADWLKAKGVTHVAIEATGVYWKPIFYTLEGVCEVTLVNAAHAHNVPGRKTDVKDSEWLAELMEAGLLQASFIPPKPIREMRDLTRYRTELVQERTRQVQRLHKFLQDSGIKLASVASNIMGASGRAMLEALVGGTTDAQTLAELARGRLRKKLPELQRALVGHFEPHHGFMVSQILAHVDYLEEAIANVQSEIEVRLRPFASQMELLKSIPGVSDKVAAVIVAEIGTEMKQFPSADHLSAWAGVCPGNNESAGKRKRARLREGDPWLRTALVEAAWAVVRKRDTSLSARYYRIRARRGPKKAILAVAHTILRIVHKLLSTNQKYKELGPTYCKPRNKERVKERLLKRLQELGYEVTLKETA